MPTYVYRCKACEHEFEKIQRMTEEPVKKCPECDGEVARLVFPIGVVFKGSGFHINDYPSSGSGGRTPDTTSEPKPEAKAETKAEDKTSQPAKETAAAGK